MSPAQLGHLEKIDLREVCPNEATSCTPWLAQRENLDLPGEAINVDLEHEATERRFGPFRADILCKDIGTGHLVLIEKPT
jgi:hypothetical protein